MKKMLCVLLAILLMTAAPCYSTAEGWGEECSPTLEDQLFEMNEWMYSGREALLAEDYDLAAFYLQRIAIYDTELFPDEVTWALATLGDLCAAGLYCDENSDETGETPDRTPTEQAIAYYEQAMAVYDQNEALPRRDDTRYLDFRTRVAMKLGNLYASETRYAEAVSCYEFVVRFSFDEQLRIEAEYRLGLLYMDESTGLPELKWAKWYLIDPFAHGHEGARQALEDLLGDDAYGWAEVYYEAEDFETAIQILIPAAENGDVACMNRLGYLYYGGLTGKVSEDTERESRRDVEKALYWYTKSAEAGDLEGMKNVVMIYVYGLRNGHAPDIDEATVIAWAEYAAENGDEITRFSVMNDLGMLYQLKGEFEKAEEWYTKAGSWGALARMVQQEEPIRDLNRAMDILEKAVGVGQDGAWNMLYADQLLKLYLDPEIGPQYDKVAELMKHGARELYRHRPYDLARLFLEEQYGILDWQEGVYWMYQAAAQGDNRAKAWFEALVEQGN